jgi:hypothetical protein
VGSYNPHAPIILGNEWVPIREPDFRPDDITEMGVEITIEHTAAVVSGYYYVKETVPNELVGVADLMAVYVAGTEKDTGPVQQVVIPASAISITGTGISGTIAGLLNPSDSTTVSFTLGDPNSQEIGIQFDVAAYQAQLQNKRILQVEFIYTVAGTDEALSVAQMFTLRAADQLDGYQYARSLKGARFITFNTQVESINMGDVNPMWGTPTSTTGDRRIYPWRWEELNNYSQNAPPVSKQQVVVHIFAPTLTGLFFINYAAMRVTYCEERRVLYGANHIRASNSALAYVQGPIPIMLRTPQFAIPTSLAPGRYTVSLSHRIFTDPSAFNETYTTPLLYALRELYELPSQSGIVVKQSMTVDDTFDSVDSDVLAQYSLHTTSAVVTGSHVYGQRIGAPVYGAITATQVISNNGSTAPTYPQVRFYARRFGDTTQSLTLTGPTTSASITPATLDALPELVDGWREVTLRLLVPPTGTNVNGNWVFSSVGEVAGNRWEVLGATEISPPQSLNAATYLAPTGATQRLTWLSPNVTGSTADSGADATLLFSQDPPAISEFVVSQLSQAISGIGVECFVPDGCVPTAIGYNFLTWIMLGECDDFAVPCTNSWCTATTGQPWTNSGGAASDYDKADGTGQHTQTAVNTVHFSTVPSTSSDNEVRAKFYVPVFPTGAPITYGVTPRFSSTTNNYYAQIQFLTTGLTSIRLTKLVAGVGTLITSGTMGAFEVGQWWNIATRMEGSTFVAKIWLDGTDEPQTWQIITVDTDIAVGANVGVESRLDSGNTNALPVILYTDDFQAFPATVVSSSLEIQRMDTEDTEWQTILDTGSLCVTGFKDLEARVGVQSWYRARLCNMLDFCGPWVSGAGTIPAPGVTVSGDGNSTLIFTSNASPLSSLAYTTVWEGKPVETFVFPEADTQTLQRMYGRDFQVAFRPLERGGEQFDRVILVQAAAITLESLANFNELRDLAWADLDYVCVRDELGNRWFANVLVPSGTVQRNRRLYLAQIRVTEVTNTPSPVT